jgi:hypothetical protein
MAEQQRHDQPSELPITYVALRSSPGISLCFGSHISGVCNSPGELQAELDSLRSLRRRSLSQPTEGLDPDLPASDLHPLSPTSPTTVPSGPSSGSESPSSPTDSTASTSPDPHKTPLADLFWLPAHLHPEIAPQEFRNFLRDHTANPENLLGRSGSLTRKRSTLSRQYHPSEKDGVGEGDRKEDGSPKVRPRASIRRPPGMEGLDKLTISDLQRLEALASQAEDDNHQQFRGLVRRSLSLNPAALVGGWCCCLISP